MFNLMGWNWRGGLAIDLFAGSGALGLEALSRGASGAVLVDVHPKSIAAIQDNVRRLRAEQRVRIWRMDWRAAWNRLSEEQPVVGWVFVDPPYTTDLWGAVLQAVGTGALPVVHGVVCEHPGDVVLPDRVGRLVAGKRRTYGDVAVTLYAPDHEVSDENRGLPRQL